MSKNFDFVPSIQGEALKGAIEGKSVETTCDAVGDAEGKDVGAPVEATGDAVGDAEGKDVGAPVEATCDYFVKNTRDRKQVIVKTVRRYDSLIYYGSYYFQIRRCHNYYFK